MRPNDFHIRNKMMDMTRAHEEYTHQLRYLEEGRLDDKAQGILSHVRETVAKLKSLQN